MTGLTAAGIRAYSEYTPARIDYDPEADSLHDRFRLWRSIEFGDLLTLLVTDERLFRSPPPYVDKPPAKLESDLHRARRPEENDVRRRATRVVSRWGPKYGVDLDSLSERCIQAH